MLADTDGFAYVKLDTVDLQGGRNASVSCWIHVEATSWESDDSIIVWAEMNAAQDVLLLQSSDIDSLAEDQWFQRAAALSLNESNATSITQFWFAVQFLVRGGLV